MKMSTGRTVWAVLACLVALAMAQVVRAEDVGTVAQVEGTAEIGHEGTFTPASVGGTVALGDEIRTGRPGRVQVTFRDESTVVVSDDSQLTVDEQVFNPDGGEVKSLLGLVQGKVSAAVGEYYHRPGTSFEIKTATAVAGVRGTEFLISYDPAQDITEVTGISGQVIVHSLADPTGPGVLVTASESTTVERDKVPTAPTRLDERLFRQRIEQIPFTGSGAAAGIGTRGAVAAPLSAADTSQSTEGGGTTSSNAVGGALNRRDARGLVGKNPQGVVNPSGQLGIGIGKH
jgi:hypothetical protein